MLVTKWFWFSLTSVVWIKHTMEVNGNQKGDILKNVGNQMVLVPTDFHSMDKKMQWKSMRPKMKIFLGMLVTKWFWVLLTYIVWTKNTMEVNGT